MTDKEMLELAAKAAGEIPPSWYGNANYFDGLLQKWNPLRDDGDALRLAVKLGIEYGFGYNDNAIVAVIVDDDLRVWVKDGDPYASTRRAIVCAAAEIGKRMGVQND